MSIKAYDCKHFKSSARCPNYDKEAMFNLRNLISQGATEKFESTDIVVKANEICSDCESFEGRL